eukprot:g11782.t1
MHALVIVVTAIACVHIGVSLSNHHNVKCTNSFGDHFEGGECFATNLNSLSNGIAKNASIEDPEIKEWHFHVYWFQNNRNQKEAALRIRSELIEHVRKKDFIVVLDGVGTEILPKLKSNVPPINNGPRGPHPIGSYEVWTPKESIAKALSYFMRRRGGLSILLHPLTMHTVQDHTGRAMWLGKSFNLDLSVLCEDCPEDKLQYPELGLGYSA